LIFPNGSLVARVPAGESQVLPAINSIIEANSPGGASDEAREPGALLTRRIKRRETPYREDK
jgi:hypothetical protein